MWLSPRWEEMGVSNEYADKTVYITLARPWDEAGSENGFATPSGAVEFSLMLCDSLKVHVQRGFDVLSKGVLGFGGVDGLRREYRALWLA